jgi:hypothetical protein
MATTSSAVDLEIGRLMREYADALNVAIKAAKKLAKLGYERPWISRTDAEENETYYNSIVTYRGATEASAVTGERMRLEVR